MNQEQQSTLGLPMYVESLMTYEEWRKARVLFPKTYVQTNGYQYLHRPKPNTFKWRHRMGEKLSPEEIRVFNERLEEIKNKSI